MSITKYEYCTGKLWDRNKCVAKHVSVIRRVKKSEAFGGAHGRMAAIPSEKGDFVRWRFVSIEVQARVKVFLMSMARAVNQRHTLHCHRKITAILDATIACFHKDMDGLIHAHPPREN